MERKHASSPSRARPLPVEEGRGSVMQLAYGKAFAKARRERELARKADRRSASPRAKGSSA